MSVTKPYECCAICENLRSARDMETIQVRDERRLLVRIRVCRFCLHPRITYIHGLPGGLRSETDPRILAVTVTVSLVCLSVILGIAEGTPRGLFLVLASICAGVAICLLLLCKRGS
jgi:hypothetical protein